MLTNPDGITSRARSLYNRGDFAAASKLFEGLCRSDSRNADLWTMHGACNLKLGDIKVAMESLRKALDLSPDSLAARSYLASAMAMSGDLKAAASMYQEIVELQPSNYIVWLQLSETYLRLIRPDDAVQACNKTLQLQPRNIRCLMTLGKALHAQENRDEALKCFKRVLELKPDHISAHEAVGGLLHELGELDDSIDAYRKALALNPNRALSYFYLGLVFEEKNSLEDAEQAYRKTIEFKPDHIKAHKHLGYILRKLHKQEEALSLYQKALTVSPGDADIHLSFGNTLREFGRIEEAAMSYRTAINLNPDEARYTLALGKLYQAKGEHENALDCFQKTLRLKPDSATSHYNKGQILYTQGRHEEAVKSFREALRCKTDSPTYYTGLAAALMALNKHEEARVCCEKAMQLQPNDSEATALAAQIAVRQGEVARAYNLLHPLLARDALSDNIIMAFANVSKDVGRADEAIRLLEQVLDKSADRTSETLVNLHFSLGKLYDREGIYDKAFHHFERGNSLKQVFFDPLQHMMEVDAFIALHTWRFMTSLPRASIISDRPVFITGMPRSGTTLVEQILSSHPAVYGAGELTEIGDIAGSLPVFLGTQQRFPQCLSLITSDHLDRLASAYLGKLAKLSPDAKRVTDKMLGFFYLGLIELMLPSARVIHCVRDPLDTCLSGYFQDFSRNHPYSYNLEHLGVYYRGYQKIMHLWKNALSIPMLEVKYEDLVANQESVSRKLIEFCGLEWNERCLRFHENRRYIATASFDQVRRPMYNSSAGRWKFYEKFIGPLQKALESKFLRGDYPV
jgi:tetratricopeptide (TPR) repeat protein